MSSQTVQNKTPVTGGADTGSRCVLTINSGSSSIKCALFPFDSPRTRLLSGKIERIGLPGPVITIKDGAKTSDKLPITAPDHRAAGEFLIGWLEQNFGFSGLLGIGHRVVHGGADFTQSQRVSRQLVEELHRLSPYDPEHLPSSLEL